MLIFGRRFKKPKTLQGGRLAAVLYARMVVRAPPGVGGLWKAPSARQLGAEGSSISVSNCSLWTAVN